MAGRTLGLEVAFYLYPCGLLVTLFLSQLIQYRYRHLGHDEPSQAKRVEKIERFYARVIRVIQALLSILLVWPRQFKACAYACTDLMSFFATT
jgi:ATP-binding cassette, subfamily B, vacuolar membrane transporter HMT1/ACLQ